MFVIFLGDLNQILLWGIVLQSVNEIEEGIFISNWDGGLDERGRAVLSRPPQCFIGFPLHQKIMKVQKVHKIFQQKQHCISEILYQEKISKTIARF